MLDGEFSEIGLTLYFFSFMVELPRGFGKVVSIEKVSWSFDVAFLQRG